MIFTIILQDTLCDQTASSKGVTSFFFNPQSPSSFLRW